MGTWAKEKATQQTKKSEISIHYCVTQSQCTFLFALTQLKSYNHVSNGTQNPGVITEREKSQK